MERELDLAALTNRPTPVDIGGRRVLLSEYTLAQLGRLQAWIKENRPHPLDAVRGRLAGFDPAEREAILEAARAEARDWPPVPGTKAGSEALFGSPAGMLFALRVALESHHPEAAERDARWLLRQMGRQGNEDLSRRIVAILFGNEGADDDDDGGLSFPKSPGA